jgi:hypothetical protein
VFSQKQLFTDKLPDNLQFYKISPGQSLGSLVRPDLIYSWSVLEHVEISILPSIIKDMHDSLSPQGQIFCQIAPLYFSPFGSHLREFTDLPWAHLLFSHDDYRQLIEAQENKSLSPEQRNKRRWMFKNYESLNRITAEQLECYFIEAGFKITEKKLKVVGLSPPPALSRAYKEFALTNNELIFFASKGTARAGQCFWDRIRQ